MGEHKACFLFPHLFLRQLPAQVLAALSKTAMTDCHGLVEEAEPLLLAGQLHCPTSPGFSNYAAVAPGCNLTSATPTAVPVQDAMGFTAATFLQRQGMCFYHANFGLRAKRYQPP